MKVYPEGAYEMLLALPDAITLEGQLRLSADIVMADG
jgi:hypothetical protein